MESYITASSCPLSTTYNYCIVSTLSVPTKLTTSRVSLAQTFSAIVLSVFKQSRPTSAKKYLLQIGVASIIAQQGELHKETEIVIIIIIIIIIIMSASFVKMANALTE